MFFYFQWNIAAVRPSATIAVTASGANAIATLLIWEICASVSELMLGLLLRYYSYKPDLT